VTQRLRFPYIPPGSNALARMHWSEVARIRRQLRQDIGYLTTRIDMPERARLTMDFRWRSAVHRDPSNYVEGTKALVDGLIGRWIIADDAEHLELVVRGQTGTGEPDHILLSMEEL
jgi:hypothetical protein